MRLTDLEKEFITKINNNEISDIHGIRDVTLKEYIIKSKIGDNVQYFSNNIIEVRKQLQRLLPIVSFLHSNDLVIFHENRDSAYDFIKIEEQNKSPKNDEELEKIIKPYRKIRFTPSVALSDYIKNNFKTNDERKANSEACHRKLVSFITIGIAFLSLIVGLKTTCDNKNNYRSDKIKNAVKLLAEKGTLEGLNIIDALYNDEELALIKKIDCKNKIVIIFSNDKIKASNAYNDLINEYIYKKDTDIIKIFKNNINKRIQRQPKYKFNFYTKNFAKAIIKNKNFKLDKKSLHIIKSIITK